MYDRSHLLGVCSGAGVGLGGFTYINFEREARAVNIDLGWLSPVFTMRLLLNNIDVREYPWK